MCRPPRWTLVVVAIGIGACASAGKLLNQGAQAEAAGNWYEAAMRYADALDRDPSMEAARLRLLMAGDSSVRQGMRAAGSRTTVGDLIGGAEEYARLDRLLARAREVDVELPTPDGFSGSRRASYDAAIATLMTRGATAGTARRWQDARAAFVRARTDFEPSESQTRRSQGAEVRLLLDWGLTEEMAERYRSAYGRADEALHVATETPEDVTRAATELKARALAVGGKRVAIFPLQRGTDEDSSRDGALALELSDVLEVHYWASPPPFISVVDPAAVREAARARGRFDPTRLSSRDLDRLHADFGVVIEIVRYVRSDEDVKRRTQSTRTRDGKAASYQVESGRTEYTLEVRVRIFDNQGTSIDRFTARGRAGRSFERGVYEGDPAKLDLDSRQRALFDRRRAAAADASSRREAIEDAAKAIAGGAFEGVLRRIP